MKVIEIRDAFGLDHLVQTERPDPEPGYGQVLLRMRAASLNYRDLMTVRGEYNPKQPLPLIPCSDGIGEVAAVGEGVQRVRVGERVATLFAQGWIGGEPTLAKLRSTLGGPLDGTLAEMMVLDEEGVSKVPENLTDEEAATLPCAALTAWSALVTHGGVRAGQTVLVQGTGGVSLFGLQIAQLLGARVLVTSGSDEKLERARALGAWETINYRTTLEWGKRALNATEGMGVDVILEVGGAATLAQSMIAVRPGGRICQIGVLTGASSELSLIPILMKQVRIQGIMVGHREDFEEMCRAIAVHRMRPAVSRIFPMAETGAALEQMAAGAHFGKIGIRIG